MHGLTYKFVKILNSETVEEIIQFAPQITVFTSTNRLALPSDASMYDPFQCKMPLHCRSWIAEILQGLSDQYTELSHRNNSGTQAAGFVNVTGSKIVDLFIKNVGSTRRILYKFQIVGPLDHVWLVEQLPYGGGYRVYQSYNNAYSLKVISFHCLPLNVDELIHHHHH